MKIFQITIYRLSLERKLGDLSFVLCVKALTHSAKGGFLFLTK